MPRSAGIKQWIDHGDVDQLVFPNEGHTGWVSSIQGRTRTWFAPNVSVTEGPASPHFSSPDTRFGEGGSQGQEYQGTIFKTAHRARLATVALSNRVAAGRAGDGTPWEG